EPATSADAPRSPVEASSPGEAPGPAADPPAHGAADPLGGGGGGGEEPTAGRGDGAGDTVATADADGPPAVAADDAGTKRRVVRIRSRRVADGPPG
ncbi:MAG TPA: hypothetical protein VFP61_07255, partial [Acidimicrobiales bacterium]|nr:hypothetical protein [Acidimicrobiales bacterium]